MQQLIDVANYRVTFYSYKTVNVLNPTFMKDIFKLTIEMKHLTEKVKYGALL